MTVYARARRYNRIGLLAALAALPWGAGGVGAAAAVGFDFESGGLSTVWEASGKVEAARIAPPVARPAGQAALHLRAQAGGGGLYTRPGQAQEDWTGVEAVRLAVLGGGAGGAGGVLEVQALEADGRARFWRKVEVAGAAWTNLCLPLAWFRWGEGRVPDWSRVQRLGFRLRGEGDVWIDDVRLVDEAPDRGARLADEDLLPVAFPGRGDRLKRVTREELAVWSDAEGLDIAAVADHLQRVVDAIRQDLPALPRRPEAARLLIFGEEEAYRAFVPRFAAAHGSVSDRPASDGYTLQAVAVTSWLPAQGALRPVFTHEFVHAFLGQRLGLPNSGEWLQEGLATRYQARFHPQANLGGIVLEGLQHAGSRLPLEELCSGRPIPLRRYWQAMTVVDALCEGHGAQWPALLDFFRGAGDTRLAPALDAACGLNLSAFGQEWESRTRQRWEPRGKE